MIHRSTFYMVSLMWVAFATADPEIEMTTRLNLNPTVTKAIRKCMTKNNLNGICVPYHNCNDAHEIVRGGILDESVLRSKDCEGREWCCSEKAVNIKSTVPPPPPTERTTLPPPPPPPSSSPKPSGPGCIITRNSDCPWCVKLYREDIDWRIWDTGFFCMGALIATNVILTTATCALQTENQTVWARVPNSADPNTNYTIAFKLMHPEYNSGSRNNDIALFRTQRDVEVGQISVLGACISNKNYLMDECIAAGINDFEEIVMQTLMVTSQSCGLGGRSVDAACGYAINDCLVVPGSPVMCAVGNDFQILAGLTKMPCNLIPPRSLLGNLEVPSTWLIDTLKGTMGLQEKDFLIYLNFQV